MRLRLRGIQGGGGGGGDVLSTLQHMRQIQPGSPLRTRRRVRLLEFDLGVSDGFGGWRGRGAGAGATDTYTRLEVRVQQLPTKVRRATVRVWEWGLFL